MSARKSADSDDQGALTLVQRPIRSDTWASTSSATHIVESAHQEIHVSAEAIVRWAEHVKALDDEQRKTFLRQIPDGGLVGYAEAVDEVIDARISKSKAGRSSRWITPLVDFLNICKPLTEALGEAYPPARLILGGIMFALSMTQRVIKYQESLVQFLNKVMSSLAQLDEFRTAFPDTSEIQEALVDVFDIILQVCARVSTLFMSNEGKQKSSLRLLPRSFDKDFGEWIQLLDLNLEKFDRKINLVSVKKLGYLQETQMKHFEITLGSYKDFHSNVAKQARQERERVMRERLREQEERRKDLLNWLPGSSFQNTHDIIFDATLDGTGSWLLSHQTYLSWKQSFSGSLLWVHGKHGSGKSHLAARIIEELRSFCHERNRGASQADTGPQTVDLIHADDSAEGPVQRNNALVLRPQASSMLTDPHASVGDANISTEFTADTSLQSGPDNFRAAGRAALAYIYCSSELIRTSGNTQGSHLTAASIRYDTTDLLASILKQLYRYLPLDKDVPRLRELCFDAHIERPSREDIIHGIKSVIKLFYRTFIVVDGLDECSEVEISEFEGLCNHLATLADLGGAGPSASVLLFSRDGYPAISSATNGYPSIEVDQGANIEDITRFIDDRSKQLTKNSASLKEIQEHLLSSADGMFLWVSLVIDSIKKERTARKMKLAALNMPRGLSGAYAGALKRILNNDEPARGLALRALLWITNSKKPLTKPQLLEVLALEEGMSSMDADERLDPDIPLTTDCADLLVLKDGHYTLLHASLGDFLRSLPEESVEGLTEYRDLQVQAQQILAENCITFLRFDAFEIGPMSTEDEMNDLFERHPFLEYAGVFWGDHLREALDREAHGLRDAACSLIRATNTRRLLHQIYTRDLSNIGVRISPFPFPPDTTPLHLLSIFGLSELLCAFDPDKKDISQPDGFGYWPIDQASANGHQAMCSWILDRHEDQIMDRNQGRHQLCKSSTWLVGAFVRQHWTDLMSRLLDLGHSAISIGEGLTAINLAAELGHADIVDHLLRSGTHPDTRDRNSGYTPLISAAVNKHMNVMRKLLDYSANPSLHAWNGDTALHLISSCGDVKMAEKLLNSGANIEARREESQTPLHDAASNGSETMVIFLLKSGANKEARTHSGQTPLLLAAQEGRIGAVRVLLQVGADIEVSDSFGSNVLHVAAQRNQAQTMAVLLANPLTAKILNTGNTNMQTPLHVATFIGSTDCARTLLGHGADPEIATKMGWTPFLSALRHENIEIAHILAEGHKVYPKQVATQGDTGMHVLASWGWAEHIHTLISWGIDPLSQNKSGHMALHWAVRFNRVKFVTAILAQVSSEDVPQGHGSDKLLLHEAAAKGFHEIVKCLLDWCPELGILRDVNGDLAIHLATAHKHLNCIKHLCTPEVINVINSSGRTALHYAIDQGHTAAVKYLVEHGANCDAPQSHHLQDPPLITALERNGQVIINILIDGNADTECMDLHGWRPLHFAAYHGYVELASRLLNLGCERQPQTHLGETPFFLAMRFHKAKIIELFLDNGLGTSDIETFDGSTYAHVAAYQGRLDVLIELVKTNRSVIFKTTEAGVDALYIASILGYHAVVEFLIQSGMKPSGMGRFVDIPLAVAAGNGHKQTVDMLLRLGARVNETDIHQRTPLSRAVDQGYLSIAHHLLKAGADPYILDATGFTAFDYCANNPAMMEILRPWGLAPCIYGMPRSSTERLSPAMSCIIRSARAVSRHRRKDIFDYSQVNDTSWHLGSIRLCLLRLALSQFTSPCLLARKSYTAVPAKRAEILREWRVILADSQDRLYCCFCEQKMPKVFFVCSICSSSVCELCFSRLKFETQPHVHIEVWKEFRQLEKNMFPISTVLRGLAYQDSRVVGEVLSQDNIFKHWVLAKRQEYAKWRKRWGLHHFRTRDFHGYNLVHTMAHVLSHEHDRHIRDDESVSDCLNTKHCNNTQETRIPLTERWQNIFFFYSTDDDLDKERCTHSFFLKASKSRQSLREPGIVFDSEGKLTSETFEKLADKYEDCLASGDLTFDELQTRRFTDSIIEASDVGNDQSEQAIEWESTPGVAADSSDETSSMESSSDNTSDVTDASAVLDTEVEAQPEIDAEEVLERLLVKRGSLIKEKLLTEESDLVLETAWKLVQAIVYHDTPRPSLADIAEQGGEWHTAPGSPVECVSSGCSDDSSHYSTAGSI